MPGQNIRVFRLAQLFDQRLFLRNCRRPISHAGLGLNPIEPTRRTRVMQALDRADQGFGRHAAHVNTGASDGACANQGHARTSFARGDGSGETSGAGADHGEIIGAVLG